ncbi:MAG: zinc-dependent alcohol dehydrogenase family protein [Lachnospiraceae bacterium]|nr:zinc-dependent alcohol dehydrogenase family protein [Lachnospiraceae bacterium]
MRGSFFLGADHSPKFEVRDMEFAPLGEHDVLVRNKACGVCGTDVHIYHGEKGSAEVTPPVVLGHEFAGIVEKVGSKVTCVKAGDHVAMDPNMYCGKCRPCRMGKKQNCENLFALGVNVNGGFAEYSLCPDTQVYVMDKSLDFKVAAMAEPLACAIHGIDRADIKPGQIVLVIGGGTIGLLMVQLAKLKGASTVILSEPIEMRRKIGLEVGADAAIDPINSDLLAEIKQITGVDGADVVIECVGKPFAVEQAIKSAGACGNILLFSVPGVNDTVPLPLFDVYKKELTIAGSMINPDTHQRAVNLLNGKRLEIEKLITHTFDIDHLEDAIKTQMGSESIKVVVEA